MLHPYLKKIVSFQHFFTTYTMSGRQITPHEAAIAGSTKEGAAFPPDLGEKFTKSGLLHFPNRYTENTTFNDP
jgi:hypothetical protein